MTPQDDRIPPADPSLYVLVVEDEPIVRMAAMDMVSDAGFVAIEARNATEAVIILEQRPDIRIVFTDIDMPGGLDGTKLAAAIRDRWPPIEIILTSGNLKPAAEMMPPRSIFLPKPYTSNQLISSISSFAC